MCNCNKNKIPLSPEEQISQEQRRASRQAELDVLRANFEENQQDNPSYEQQMNLAGLCAYCGNSKKMCTCP